MPTRAQVKASIDEQITNKTAPFSIDNKDVGARMKDVADLTAPLQFETTQARLQYLFAPEASPFQDADDKEDGNKYYISKDKSEWKLYASNDPKIEVITFNNQSQIVISWNAARKAKFGANADFIIETLDDDGKYRRQYGLEIIADSISNTTSFTIDLGGVNKSGRLTIK
jgi:hypothetical protein